jgi:tRNA(His) 5'-end guanylyltransferase
MTTVVSTFTAYYMGLWSGYFPGVKLTTPMPTFDGRCICYPTVGNLRDYMSWRQVDCELLFSTPLTWRFGSIFVVSYEKEWSDT